MPRMIQSLAGNSDDAEDVEAGLPGRVFCLAVSMAADQQDWLSDIPHDSRLCGIMDSKMSLALLIALPPLIRLIRCLFRSEDKATLDTVYPSRYIDGTAQRKLSILRERMILT